MLEMGYLTQEQLRVLCPDTKNFVVAQQVIYQGTVNSSVVRAAEVFSTWHLMDRWWERSPNPAMALYSLRHGEQDRTYYRVCCRGSAGEQVFDLYHDAVTNQWVLDVAHD